MTHDQHCPANQGGGCLGPPTCEEDRPRVPVFAGDTGETIATIPVDPELAEVLERNDYRLTFDTTPFAPQFLDVKSIPKLHALAARGGRDSIIARIDVFEAWVEAQEIRLSPSQTLAARAILAILYAIGARGSGKTFLLGLLERFDREAS